MRHAIMIGDRITDLTVTVIALGSVATFSRATIGAPRNDSHAAAQARTV